MWRDVIHGSIQIGTSIIGAWQVRRMDPLKGADDTHRYRYTVVLNEHSMTGSIEHEYVDGAAHLLAKVFRAVADEMADQQGPRLRGYAERIMEVQDL